MQEGRATAANSRQLFADQHVDVSRAAETRPHGDDTLRLWFHLADNAGIAAARVLSHAISVWRF
jgi:hypothetical protein